MGIMLLEGKIDAMLRGFPIILVCCLSGLPARAQPSATMTADECVARAIENNSQLKADLAGVAVARADIIDARQIREPLIQMLLPIGPKRFELLWTQPLDLLIQRPKRIRAAELNVQRLAESLVQNGVNLARDVRIAHADVLLAEDRARIASESAALRDRIAGMSRKRLAAGDISLTEVRLLELDALQALQQAAVFRDDRRAAEERLRLLMGMRGSTTTLSLRGEDPPLQLPNVTLEAAMAGRPEVKAAGIEIDAARERARIERIRPFVFGAGFSSKGSGSDPIRTGPAINGEPPILNRNRGGIARAEADIERLEAQRLATRDRVETEVRQAQAQLGQAQANLTAIRKELIPLSREAVLLAETSFRQGDISRLNVLEASRQTFDADLREADAVAAARRAWAELERSMGRKP